LQHWKRIPLEIKKEFSFSTLCLKVDFLKKM
jgi:hypothetical protein